MNAEFATRHWTLVANTARGGIELLGAPCVPAMLVTTVDAAVATLRTRDVAFLLVRLSSTNRVGVETALRLARGISTPARLCLAIDRWTLAQVGTRPLDTTRAGLLLDDVGADTPPSAITHEAIEAIRFGSDYVSRATRQIRLGCALEAMLSLARNLGIATLGPATAGKEQGMPGMTFDYTLRERAPYDPPVGPDRPHRRESEPIELYFRR